ncbi:transcription-repair coupling factor [Ruminococcaceae bacterium OttesenSCG-928-L11]|nr:transcription-repair coupling factor [Ruminococcaceae bacterium OttesenSCG-928-L11]
MKHFYKLMAGEPRYREIMGNMSAGRAPQMATGLSNIHKAHYIYCLCEELGQEGFVLAPNEPTALKLCEDLNALYGYEAALFYPAREMVFREMEGVSREYEHTRLGVLDRIVSGTARIVVASIEGAVQHTLPAALFRERTLTLRPGEEHSVEALAMMLVKAGYIRAEQVEGVSQFAIRGGLLDFSPPGAALPYRVEFWGDEIDTISTFAIDTQRRVAQVDEVRITPAREVLIGDGEAFLHTLEKTRSGLRGKYGALAKEQIAADMAKLDSGLALENADKYLPLLYPQPAAVMDYCAGRLVFACEPVSMKETLKNGQWQIHEDIKLLLAEGVLFKGCDTFSLDFGDVAAWLAGENTLVMDTFTRSLPDLPLKALVNVNAIQLSAWSGDYGLLKEDVDSYMERDYAVVVFAGTDRACAAIHSDLARDGINAEIGADVDALSPGKVWVVPNTLSAGLEYPDSRFALVSHSKTAMQPQKRKRRHKDGKKIKALSDLAFGDYVVHTAHGIGVFEGIVKRDMHGVIKDYIKIRYAGTDALFVPVTQLDLVSKYIGAAEGGVVRLHKLNSVEWQKTRARVKSAVKDMAKELIALYAKRMNAPGFAFSADSDWQKEFEERFPFEETEDQLRCVEEIKADMQKPNPMDRLLCGDVGFGKTEVALRAVFKCVLDSKQCAVLVPTTILAWQHYQTFTQRLEGYPITVEFLSRFKTAKEQEAIIRRVKRGQVDVLIGTHRIVQKDIAFKDLGLCIIDEEQRFGVAHKEKFKEMRANIDVLTLSATPIPRTLNMAMSGIRDMSIIEEAPQDRYPVQTYVLEHDLGVLTQAIQKELRRGGQVFYLHNRIDTIDGCAARLKERLPDARIATAHGKIGEEALGDIWQQLIEHEIDILVCTTIIETGVDVPNCNTLIIEDADRMGLSQLYQIRGRVGRSTRRAYAYLTFHKGKALTDVASKRLAAIREFTAFGSGFRIAMRDLEIRGAGNILGAQQHGHMEAVGYDLYLKLLSEAVSEEQGVPNKQPTECIIDVRLDAHIPENYIENLSQRIDIYKKIASVQTDEDALDMIDELIDRFGDPPESVKGLVDVALMRNRASLLGIKEISQQENQILLYPEALDFAMAGTVAGKMKGRVLVNAGAKPYIIVKMNPGQGPVEILQETLENMSEVVR